MADQHPADLAGSRVAACIGEPARARMLYCLLDGHARTSTELAIVAGVSASTASVHLARLRRERLVTAMAQGKHRYYRLEGPKVAAALEALMVIAGEPRARFVPRTPNRLRFARTCYDHLAGEIAVLLHDRLRELRWISAAPVADEYELSAEGARALAMLGVNVDAARAQRRRFAYACVDWSERRPHMAGALGAALLQLALKRRWVVQELDSRALRLTRTGSGELLTRFGLSMPDHRSNGASARAGESRV
ncbi:MAG TPA: helix-turn-helix transcriptional regulator [Steroidobacteraceae bacterium]|nr:helix-turn-helix transcriptional regulator [Steroidobacteraceae bacterium]